MNKCGGLSEGISGEGVKKKILRDEEDGSILHIHI
jgi:hypothetical protein